VFFQAEDGIRDFHVTGVQTCALPICSAGSAAPVRTLAGATVTPVSASHGARPPNRHHRPHHAAAVRQNARAWSDAMIASEGPGRSEERRVGKECRLWGSTER